MLKDIFINGLEIKKPNIFIDWNCLKSEMFLLDSNFVKVTDNYFTLIVEITELPFITNVGLHFINE